MQIHKMYNWLSNSRCTAVSRVCVSTGLPEAEGKKRKILPWMRDFGERDTGFVFFLLALSTPARKEANQQHILFNWVKGCREKSK